MLEQESRKQSGRVFDVRIDAISLEAATEKIIAWGNNYESRYVCAVNVHSVVTSLESTGHAKVLEESDLNLSDGFPIAKLLGFQGFAGQQRVSGPDITLALCAVAEQAHIPIYFLGSTDAVLVRLVYNLRQLFPQLAVVGSHAPPFREMSSHELENIREDIKHNEAQLVFVGLGCPKQEIWMLNQKGHVNAVMIGVGAAFEFIAGTQRRAPLWLQKIGLEWLYRGIREPRRLAWRYIRTNTIFVLKVIPEFLTKKKS